MDRGGRTVRAGPLETEGRGGLEEGSVDGEGDGEQGPAGAVWAGALVAKSFSVALSSRSPSSIPSGGLVTHSPAHRHGHLRRGM